MLQRVVFFAYGLVCYSLFLASFLYAIGFVGGFIVPTTLDGAPRLPFAPVLAIDLGLLTLFAVQHSVMARKSFKERWTNIVPVAIERSTYVLASSLALGALCLLWQPLGGTIWALESPVARGVMHGLLAFGFGLVLLSTFLINHFELFGLSQVWYHLRKKQQPTLAFVTPGPYRIVRHPLYAGFVCAFWAAPTMTVAHLVFAVATTAYILVAIQLEERDLMRQHGADYERYRRSVPMLVPGARRRAA